MSVPYQVIEKAIGETPLQALERYRIAAGIESEVPLSYAGRLDPMASGKLLVLIGDACKQQKAYTGLDKEYVVEVLLGVSSDTGDILGIPTLGLAATPDDAVFHTALEKERGTHEHPYPAFSSKTVEGKPLFLYALEGNLHTITIPTHPETFYDITLEERVEVEKERLEERIFSLLSTVPRTDEPSKALGADFRQDAIRDAWRVLFETAPPSFVVYRLRITSGSGAYMRSLALRIGEHLGTGALALSIHRTILGTFDPTEGRWTSQL